MKKDALSNKKDKGVILQELCESSGYHKKHAIRLLNNRIRNKPYRSKSGRPKIYSKNDYLEPLKGIWLLRDQLCLFF